MLSGSHDLSGSINETVNHSLVLEGSEEDVREAFGIIGGEEILPGIIPEWDDWMEHAVPWTLKKNQHYISQIDDYLVRREGNHLKIITPTVHDEYYDKGILRIK